MALSPALLLAGETGKIAGRVVDKDTGQPLPFANVMVVGTKQGAVTDLDGYYHIINVRPGTYSVEGRMMGYSRFMVTGVEVVTDLTNTVNFSLTTEVIGIDTVRVVGVRVLALDATGHRDIITSERIEARRPDDFREMMESSVGAVKDPQSNEIHVRGGRGGEVLYMVDGMSVRDPLLGGGLGIRIATNAIEEMSVMAGGFEAEYGQAQSGVVSLVTREGSVTEHSGNILYRSDHALGTGTSQGAELNRFYGSAEGPKLFSFNTDWAEFSAGGPEPISHTVLPLFGYKPPGELTYFLSGTFEWTDTYTPYRHYDTLTQKHNPDNGWTEFDREAVYDGVNFLGDEFPDKGTVTLADLLFGNSSWGTDTDLMSKRQRNTYSTNAKLAYKISPRMKLTGGFRKSWAWRHEYSHEYKYAPQNAFLRRDDNYQWTMDWNHTLESGNTFYNVRLGKFDRSYSADHGFDPGYWWENKDGIAFDGKDSLSFYRTDGVDKWCVWHEHEIDNWTLKGDLSHQAGRVHLVKSGVELNYYEIYNGEIQYPHYSYSGEAVEDEPWPYCGVFRDFYFRTPTQGAFYIQDKIETEGMIIKPGMRFDFWYPGSQVETFIDPITWDTTHTTFKSQFSPRLGVAYPITERDKLYFNYGLFSQIPELQYLYQRSTQGGSAYKYYGNPDLDAERTTQYELGVAHAFTDRIKMEVSGYFKDIRGLMDMEMRGEPPFEGHQFQNADYGDCRGVHVSLDKRYSNFTSGSASYTLQWAYGKSSSDRQNYDYDYRGNPIPIRSYPLNWDQRHAVSVNFDLRAPEGQHPVLFGRRLPDRWGINVLWEFGSGLPWTPSSDYGTYYPEDYDPLEPPNQRRLPLTSVVDLKANKDFNLGPLSYSFLVEIRNLFDRKEVLELHADTGQPGWETPGGGNPDLRNNPTHWGPRRQMFAGLSIGW